MDVGIGPQQESPKGQTELSDGKDALNTLKLRRRSDSELTQSERERERRSPLSQEGHSGPLHNERTESDMTL